MRNVTNTEIDVELFASGPVSGPLDSLLGRIDARCADSLARKIEGVPPVTAAQIESALHLSLYLVSVVGKLSLNQPRTEANDILIRIPHGHEFIAVNSVPVLVFLALWLRHSSDTPSCLCRLIQTSSSDPYSAIWNQLASKRATQQHALLYIRRQMDWSTGARAPEFPCLQELPGL